MLMSYFCRLLKPSFMDSFLIPFAPVLTIISSSWSFHHSGLGLSYFLTLLCLMVFQLSLILYPLFSLCWLKLFKSLIKCYILSEFFSESSSVWNAIHYFPYTKITYLITLTRLIVSLASKWWVLLLF